MDARYFIFAAFAALAGGCATSFELKNPVAQSPHRQARLAADAAVGAYPSEAEPRPLALTAVVDRDAKSLQVINPTDQTYHGVRVWLDGRHVAWVNTLSARGVVQIAEEAFASDRDARSGGRLSLAKDDVRQVEMQTNGELYRLLGPAVAPSQRSARSGRGFELAFPSKRRD